MQGSPMCVSCKRRRADWACDAYPGGIPEQILAGDWDHRLPKPGDNGLLYDPEPDAPPQMPWWPDEKNEGPPPPRGDQDVVP